MRFAPQLRWVPPGGRPERKFRITLTTGGQLLALHRRCRVSRRRYAFDEAKVQRFIAQGRGAVKQGKYVPWLKITDLPSIGRSHRLYSDKTGRIHHLLSDGEWKTFLKFEFDPTILEILEGFPLDRFQTYQVACDLGLRHPITLSGTPYVMTVDFLVRQLVDGRVVYIAYSFKYYPKTLPPRQWELFRIAKECLRRQGIPLILIDETSFNEHFTQNFDSVRACFDLSDLVGFDEGVIRCVTSAFLNHLPAALEQTLLEACYGLAASTRARPDVVFTVVKHLIARGILVTDLGVSKDLTQIRLCEIKLRHSRCP